MRADEKTKNDHEMAQIYNNIVPMLNALTFIISEHDSNARICNNNLIFNNPVEMAEPFNVVSQPRCCEPRN